MHEIHWLHRQILLLVWHIIMYIMCYTKIQYVLLYSIYVFPRVTQAAQVYTSQILLAVPGNGKERRAA